MRFMCGSTAALAVVTSIALGACRRVEEPGADRHTPVRVVASSLAAANDDAATLAKSEPSLLAPTQLLTLPSSAYQASLFADDEAIELLTASAVYRLLPGKEPAPRALDLGFAATLTRQSYVYWSQGAIWSAPRRAPGATKLAILAEQPQRFVADMARDEFAFLTRSEGDRYAIHKLENRRVKTLYTSPGSIDALTMIGDALYFVERPSGGNFRIARVKLAGGDATFTSSKTGRWPARLAGNNELIYYDGARRNVLALSLDLQHERELAKDFICSPMAVAASVYCSTMEGIFELSATGQPRQVVAASRALITNVAANSESLVFITDVGTTGQDRLAVNVVPLGKPGAAEPPR
jgi:hypothetical protein